MASATTITRSVTISPGESFTLPAGATVISLTDVLTNTCDVELPEPEPFVEYQYIFALNQDDNDSHPMGGEVDINSLLIDNTVVNLNFTVQNTDNSGNGTRISQWNLEVPDNNVLLNSYPIKFTTIVGNTSIGSKYDLVIVSIRMPESYQDKVLLKVVNDKFPNGLYLKGSI